MIIPTLGTAADVQRQRKNARDWFLKFKPLSPEMILNKITNSAFLDSEKDESLDKYSSGITIIADG